GEGGAVAGAQHRGRHPGEGLVRIGVVQVLFEVRVAVAVGVGGVVGGGGVEAVGLLPGVGHAVGVGVGRGLGRGDGGPAAHVVLRVDDAPLPRPDEGDDAAVDGVAHGARGAGPVEDTGQGHLGRVGGDRRRGERHGGAQALGGVCGGDAVGRADHRPVVGADAVGGAQQVVFEVEAAVRAADDEGVVSVAAVGERVDVV